jgi:putative endonuclease
MVWSVYAISAQTRKYIYVGLSNNLLRRVEEHQRGYNKTTNPYRPFKLIYSKSFDTRIQAREHEKYLKSSPGKRFLYSQIANSDIG